MQNNPYQHVQDVVLTEVEEHCRQRGDAQQQVVAEVSRFAHHLVQTGH